MKKVMWIFVTSIFLVLIAYYFYTDKEIENGVKIDKIIVFYNRFVNTITQQVESLQLLPIEQTEQEEMNQEEDNGVKLIYSYEPNPQAIIDHLLPMYVENTLYGIILDSKASEHASRMTAMKIVL